MNPYFALYQKYHGNLKKASREELDAAYRKTQPKHFAAMQEGKAQYDRQFPSLFDTYPKESREIHEETEKAIARGYAHADEQWREMALKIVRDECCKREELTANDVRPMLDAMPVQPHDNRIRGGLMRDAESRGWVVKTGKVIKSKVGHGTTLQIWKSLLYPRSL